MVQRGRNKYHSNKGNIKGYTNNPKRLIHNDQDGDSAPSWPEDDVYTSPDIMDDAYSARAFPTGQQYMADNLPEDGLEWQHTLPIEHNEETALAPIDLNPFYEALSEMRERIREAEQNLDRSRQVQQTLRQEMDTAAQMAQEAEEELAAAAKKAAYLKHEAEQIFTEGQTLQRQLNAEEQRWLQILDAEQRLLADTEQKLRIADEESQHIRHAKEVAARMNERELWRLGSSKQGLWLQRRKVQGNALAMTRDKSGNWHVPKVVSSPGATYAKNVLDQEQKIKQKQRDNSGQQRKKRLSMLSESAQALTDRPSEQMEAEVLERLAKQEAARHLSAQADLLDMRPDGYESYEPAPSAAPPPAASNPMPAPPSALPFKVESPQTIIRPETPPAAPNPMPAPPTALPFKVESPQTIVRPETPPAAPNPMPAPTLAPPLNAESAQALRSQEMPQQAAANLKPAPTFAPPLNTESAQALRRQEMPRQTALNHISAPTLTPTLNAELPQALASLKMPRQVMPSHITAPTLEAAQALASLKMPQQVALNPIPAPTLAPPLSEELPQNIVPLKMPKQAATSSAPEPPAYEPLAGLRTLLRQVMPKQTEPDPLPAPSASEDLPQILPRQHLPERTAPTPTPDPPAHEPLAGLRTLLRQVMPTRQTAVDPVPAPPPAPPLNEELLRVLTHLEAPERIVPAIESQLTSSMNFYVSEMVQSLSQQSVTAPSAPSYARLINGEVAQVLRGQETAEQKAPPPPPAKLLPEYMSPQTAPLYTPPLYTPPANMEAKRDVPPQTASTYAPPLYSPPTNIKAERGVPPQTASAYETPLYTPPPTKQEHSVGEYAPAVNDALLHTLRPYETPGQSEPPTDDPLQFLAMQAAMETAARRSVGDQTESYNLDAQSQEQLAAAAEQLQAGQQPPKINEDDMQKLTRQANLLAKQHLARHQAASPTNDSVNITQRVAEETGSQDHLLKEQQIAERAIAAAMAAAKKAAQSAMSISEQQNKQVAPNSAEQLIAAALSKASESGK